MKIKEIQVRYTGIIVLSFVLPFAFGFQHSYYLLHVLHSFVITFTNWSGCVWIMQYYQKKYPSYSLTKPRILSELLAVAILIVFIVITHKALMTLLYGYPFTFIGISHHMSTNVLITLFAGAFYESRYFFERWNQTLTETQRLRRQTTQSQLEVLKNQVNPHFLFNSLNTLLTLIPENKQVAKKFTRKLGEVYQYIIKHQNQELTTIQQEFDFIKAYLFLQQMRFGENLKAHIDIPATYLSYQIIPLSLQMLVENAIKHNIVSQSKPLHINISVKDDKLLVSNNLQLKSIHHASSKNSTKIGLKNIQNRYHFFTKELVEIDAKNDCFEVKLPLLAPFQVNTSPVEQLTAFAQ